VSWVSRTDRIKKELPIEWAVGTLLGVWAPGNGDAVQCPLPGHQDDTPSFNIWKLEDGVPQRFGCFGCGTNGDVIDLVQLVRGVGFGAACDIIDSELLPAFKAAGWEPKQYEERRPVREDLEIIHARLADMSEFGHRTLERFCQTKADDANRPDFALSDFREYAVAEWGWAGAGPAESGFGTPAVAFPHRDAAGAVVGVKFRDPRRSGGRWTQPGSRLSCFYGSWRAHGAPNVLLCEGETDTVWAAYGLREDRSWDVLGLPSGANQRVNDGQLDALRSRALVYLAFDGDRPGLEAARRWYAALREASVPARIVRLPEGEDVLSSGLTAWQIIDRATVPRDGSGTIDVRAGVFCRAQQVTRGRGQNRATTTTWEPVADFAFRPLRELVTEAGPAWDVRLEDDGHETVLRATDLANAGTFTRWTVQRGRAFLGPPPIVPLLLNWLAAESSYLPLETTSSKVGRIGRGYVWPGGTVGADRARYVPPPRGDAKLEGRYTLDPGPWDPLAIRALEMLNDPPAMATLLSWLTATLLRGRQAPAPALFVSGEAGAGKTVLLETVLRTLGFSDVGLTLTSTTPYAVDCAVNASIGFPVWFDEYRPAAREDSMRRLQQILRDAYNGQPSMKGGMTQNLTELTEVSTWAGLLVSGEQGTYETSHMDRLVLVALDPDTRNRKALEWLRDNPRRWAGLGRDLLEFLAAWPLFKVRPYGDPTLPDRYQQTMGFLRAGHDAWRAFRTQAGVPGVLAEPDWERLWARRTDAEDPWLEALRFCDGKMTPGGDGAIVASGPGEVRVLPYDVVRESRAAGIDLPAGARELVIWLKRRYPGTHQPPRATGGRRYWVVPGMTLDR